MSNEKPKAKPKLAPSRIKEKEFGQQTYFVDADENTNFEDLLMPEFWTLVSAKLRPYNEIIVVRQDFAFYGRFIVVDANNAGARLLEVERKIFDDKPVKGRDEEYQGYRITFCGPTDKHKILRSDGVEVTSGISTKKDARAWIDDYIKAQAA